MKRVISVAILVLLLATPAWAILSLFPNYVAKDYEEVVVDNTAGGVSLTASKLNKVQAALVRQEGGPIRIRMDGGAPTTTSGFLVNDGDVFELTPGELTAFRAIRTGSTSGKLFVTYYKLPQD